MTKIICVAGQKGGAGKSTIAINLAAHWHSRGFRVLLVDADDQGTTRTWAAVADEQGHDRPVVVAMGEGIKRDLPKLAADYDVAVVDLPGRLAARQVGAIAHSDVVVLPCGPSTPDVWALAESAALVEDVRALRDDLAVVVLLNKRAATAESKTAIDAIATVGLPVLGAALGLRVAFSETLAAGQGIGTYAPSSMAALELRNVADELEQIANLERTADAAE